MNLEQVVERRRFLAGVGLVLAAAPPRAGAQSTGDTRRIGLLYYGSRGPSPELDAFRQGLRDHGYVEGQNVTVEYRFANGQVGQLPRLAGYYHWV